MIRPDVTKWGQTVDDLRRTALDAAHPRTRERFQALYMIASGQTNATRWAEEIGRNDESVLGWVHQYNGAGPAALTYRPTGGRAPLFTPAEVQELVDTVETTVPQAHGLPGHGWTLKKLRRWIHDKVRRLASRSLLHKVLRAAGLSWKKCKKLLGKGDPDKRAAFVVRLLELYEAVVRREVVLIYIDESHFHRDLENGYTWGRIGHRVWRRSCCAPLSDRINWYGAFNFSDGQCLIWNEGNCCKEHTAEFLQRVDEWLPTNGRRVVVIWDNAPWHTAGLVQQAGADLGFELIGLSTYSPDLNPIEGLWKWMREEVTQLQCYDTMRALFDACKAFVDRINTDPLGIVNRLWPRFELDPELEKLRFST